MLRNRITRILTWVITYLVFLEIFLWLGGQGFTFVQEFQNRKSVGGNDVYKIMCLGDSLTAVGGEDAYPSQLEKYLNQKEVGTRRFKVINRGIPAADSTIILQKVSQFIAEEKPDMVTAMMGANDRYSLKTNKREHVLERIFSRSKVFRLFSSLFQKLAARIDVWTSPVKARFHNTDVTSVQKTDNFPPVPEKDALLLLYAIQLEEQNEYAKAALILESLVGVDLEKSFHDRVWHELGVCFHEQKDYKKLIFVIAHKLSVNQFDIQATDYVRSLCREKKEEEGLLGMLSSLTEKNSQSIPLNGLLAACYADYGHKDQSNFYFSLIKNLRTQGENVVLTDNFHKLYKILKEQGIKPVFVQYANRDVAVLKEMFDSTEDYENIIFVENEKSFKSSLDQDRYKEFFIDRNYDDFGHATPYGNYLLASQIGDSILNYLNTKAARTISPK